MDVVINHSTYLICIGRKGCKKLWRLVATRWYLWPVDQKKNVIVTDICADWSIQNVIRLFYTLNGSAASSNLFESLCHLVIWCLVRESWTKSNTKFCFPIILSTTTLLVFIHQLLKKMEKKTNDWIIETFLCTVIKNISW